MASTTNQITLKLLIDPSSKKVVYAEAKKDFVDFLFGLLQVPLGSIMGNLLDNEMDGGGSMARVYKSVADMESSCLLTSRDLLLWPEMSSSSSSINIPPLLQSFVDSGMSRISGQVNSRKICNTSQLTSREICNTSQLTSREICNTSQLTSREILNTSQLRSREILNTSQLSNPNLFPNIKIDDPPSPFPLPVECKTTGFVGGMTHYMVMDDLLVKPLSPISTNTLLNTIGLKDLSSLVETNVAVDFKKRLELIKASFVSDTVLSDVFVRNQQPGGRSH